MNDIQMEQGDFEAVKGDVKKLISDVGSWIQGASSDAQQKWEETRPVLEQKLKETQEQAMELGTASAGAAGEMGKGFKSAFGELKTAFGEAKKHFAKEDSADSATDE